jgi:ATP-dependent helicase/nuclease subunit A
VRDAVGRALGYVIVREDNDTLAQPLDWDDVHAPAEARFEAAEQDRLMYVAATRAADELVIGCAYNTWSLSKWRMFYPWLKAHGTPLTLPPQQQGRRDRLEVTPEQIVEMIGTADARRRAAAVPTYRLAAVTARKGEVVASDEDVIVRRSDDEIVARGTDWGTAVHDALFAAARGIDGERLHAFCRTLLIGLGRELDADGEPVELAELLQVTHAVRASPLWQRANAAARMLVEAPFALRLTAAEYAATLGRDAPAAGDPAMEVLDGRIDLVFREADGWVIVDYKSDAGGERIPTELMRRYRGQLALYASAWERLTGEPVKEQSLLFTATGAVV